MLMLAPNTARPTMTVSMPLSRIDDSRVVMVPAMLDADEPNAAAGRRLFAAQRPEFAHRGQRPDLEHQRRSAARSPRRSSSAPASPWGWCGYRRKRR